MKENVRRCSVGRLAGTQSANEAPYSNNKDIVVILFEAEAGLNLSQELPYLGGIIKSISNPQ